MCDFSAQAAKQRRAKKGEPVVSRSISTHTRGFTGVGDPNVAVCLLPGTELAFKKPIQVDHDRVFGIFGKSVRTLGYTMARFRQVETNNVHAHHDALELPDGEIVKLNCLVEGQVAEVIQVPVDPATLSGEARAKAEAEQARADYV